jgi:hypothetical protein
MYYDVVDKDECILIFSRPLKYDVDVKHLSRDNLYKIQKNGVNLILKHLKERDKIFYMTPVDITIQKPTVKLNLPIKAKNRFGIKVHITITYTKEPIL